MDLKEWYPMRTVIDEDTASLQDRKNEAMTYVFMEIDDEQLATVISGTYHSII